MTKSDPTNEQRYSIRGQGRPQPEQARRRILVFPLRQAQPDSRRKSEAAPDESRLCGFDPRISH
jgi:hypothetical protein